jgi:para-aminobenzoate synthetase component 1
MPHKRATLPWTWKKNFNPESLCQYDSCVYLKSSSESDKNLLALGAITETSTGKFDELERLIQNKDWCFGYITYDAKNQIENLQSNNSSNYQLPQLHFFIPEIVIEWTNAQGQIHLANPNVNCQELHNQLTSEEYSNQINDAIRFEPDISKKEFLKHIIDLKEEIQQGNIYEINFCQQFKAKGQINPYQRFSELTEISPTPFAAFLKHNSFYTLCASPERYLKKEGGKLYSQPIKGTIKRGQTPEEDDQLKQQLFDSDKDRSENVMIVDLVRNDLSKTATKGSVNVEELFGIYTFPQVHQMISTVSSVPKKNFCNSELIKTTYPMGSMTGAPKVRAMQLIEKHESFKRELYSGSIGYIFPDGNFDFNVVIRSLFYDSNTQQVSFAVGGAITNGSSPEQEYQETILKAKALFKLFEG